MQLEISHKILLQFFLGKTNIFGSLTLLNVKSIIEESRSEIPGIVIERAHQISKAHTDKTSVVKL